MGVTVCSKFEEKIAHKIQFIQMILLVQFLILH